MALDRGTEAAGKRYEGLAEDYDRKDLRAFGGNKLNRYIATLLGDDEGTRKSLNLSRSIGKNLFDNDKTEDTLRHIFLGGNVKSPIGSFLIDAREWLEGMPRKPQEGQMPRENYVDVTNNKYGRALREMYPNDADFDREALKAALALYRGKEPPEVDGIKPLLSTGEEYLNYNEMSEKPVGLQPNRNEMAKGGTVMDKQMRMAFMEDGGLQDDGMDRDAVSGNDVPSGSLAEEVRDDIPAQLSEGEYVVPADVVRFFGVKFFEDLRMQAKMGLAQMERSGRIGGEPIEDDGEMMDLEDEALIVAMTPDMNKGGVVKAAEGVDLSKGETDTMPKVLGSYSFVGQSLFPTESSAGSTQKTYYHPDGRSHVVNFDKNGNINPITDTVFTQPPWSLTPPEGSGEDDGVIDEKDTAPVKRDAAEPTEKVQKQKEQMARWDFVNKQREEQDLPPIVFPGMNQDWYKNRQQSSLELSKVSDDPNAPLLVNQFDEGVQLPADNYNALLTSFNRVKGIGTGDKKIETLQDYYDLPLATRAKLGQFEWKTIFGKDLTDEDKVKMAEIVEKSEPGALEKMMGLANVGAEWFDDKFLKRGDDYVSPGQQELLDYQAEQDAKRQAAEKAAEAKRIAEQEKKRKEAEQRRKAAMEAQIKEEQAEAARQAAEEEAKKQTQTGGQVAAGGGRWQAKQEENAARLARERKRRQEARDKARAKAVADAQKQQKDKTVYTGGGAGSGSGFALDKGGLASKPKPKPKKKKTTKGLGTKPKAT